MTLTKHDQRIVDTIFNQQIHNKVHEVNPGLPPDRHVSTEIVEKLVKREKEAIQLEKDEEKQKALQIFSDIISEQPLYASAYNNRAQMQRILHYSTSLARADLMQAINLAKPMDENAPISKMQASVLQSAYNQLAAILLEESNMPENAEAAWELQLEASDMLVQSSCYNDKIAASLSAAINPYAKLCGSIIETALSHGY